MRKKIALAVVLGSAALAALVPQVIRSQEITPHYNCFGGYGGGCGDSWIKNCYCGVSAQ